MRYFYKVVNGRIGKLASESAMKKTEAQYVADGYSIAENTLAMYNVIKGLAFTNWQEFCDQRGIVPTPAELILQETNFDQGDIRRACRRIILTPAVEAVAAVPAVPATETTPEIPAVPAVAAVPAVTLERWLDALINSSEENQKDWVSEKTINITDPRVVASLAATQLPITIDALKLEILKDRRVI